MDAELRKYLEAMETRITDKFVEITRDMQTVVDPNNVVIDIKKASVKR